MARNVYSYNNRNWIASMTNSQTIFDYTNSYFLNGNVKSSELSGDYHKNFASSSSLTFDYAYDRSNRLTETSTSDKNFELFNTYDKDGNILALDRNGSSANSIDNFNYAYYSGTNKLQRVSGSGTQYTYDANGNMTSDVLNKNTNIKYDHRNLILELTHTKYILNDSLIILTKYYYDESGNRIRKMSYNTRNDSLVNDVIYSRDVSGRELAIYENGSIDQWNIYGMDNIGFINGNEDIRYYMKDHLGSVRAVSDGSGNVVSSQDYDAWGYLLENRVYESDESIYKFTSKERDDESKYDYFVARYYDARIGRWGQVEPLFDKFPHVSPFCYGLNNPIRILDDDGNWPKDGFEYHVTTAEDIKASFNEIVERVSLGYEKLFSGNIEDAYEQMKSNIIESPKLLGGLIPSDFTTDFIFPLGMARSSGKMLKLTEGLSIEKQAEEIAKAIGKNSINLGDETLDLIDMGTKLGYNKGHFNKFTTGEKIKVPHVQKNLYYYDRSKKSFLFKQSQHADPATIEHLQKALDIINSTTF